MKRLPIDISDFPTLIQEDYVYVDKTHIIYDLVTKGKLYFLARPRRFGKSLLISTLKELFEGNRELFKGLWIDSSDYSWEHYPVISFDFSRLDSRSSERFEKSLALRVDLVAEDYGIDTSRALSPGDKLEILVKKLDQKSKIVILIDEYDYPIVNSINNLEIEEANRQILSSFFTVIKGLSGSLRALFITGVSQIPKASIFSGLNNLRNISLNPLTATLLGYTKEEVVTYFSDYIEGLARDEGKTKEELLVSIQEWYNGYRFSEAEVKVYNPFSLHYLFTDKKFANYWFRSATPSFLLKLLKKNNYVLEYLESEPISENSLSTLTVEKPQLAPLLFQTGYLTIASYDKITDSYMLTYPNREVRQSYSISLLSAITDKKDVELKGVAIEMRVALENNDIDTLCSLLGSLFAHVPYQIDKREEAHYHALVHQLFVLLEVDVVSEVQTNKGRADLVVSTNKFIYIFELKVDATAEEALAQIEDRTYYERYLIDPQKRTLILVGLAFNKEGGKTTASCDRKTIKHK